MARETLGKFFYDLAKLTFAAIVLSEMIILHDNWGNPVDWVMIGLGCLLTLIFAWIGNQIIKSDKL